ncbi:hypothetical protein AGMMS50256_04090 [Betaproteobacteria bacterium]|nr:hypothetical protein AGMMS50256_04090 [Betaproteobacteria bacterium]
MRLGSTNRQAGADLLAELRRLAAGTIFDELPMPELSVHDLDIPAAQRLFGRERALDEKSLTHTQAVAP